MPRYYFHITDGLRSSVDDYGVNLRGAHDAQLQAARALVERAGDVLRGGVSLEEISVDVTDEIGNAIFSTILTMRNRR
jgi:hypothetical protein